MKYAFKCKRRNIEPTVPTPEVGALAWKRRRETREGRFGGTIVATSNLEHEPSLEIALDVGHTFCFRR